MTFEQLTCRCVPSTLWNGNRVRLFIPIFWPALEKALDSHMWYFLLASYETVIWLCIDSSALYGCSFITDFLAVKKRRIWGKSIRWAALRSNYRIGNSSSLARSLTDLTRTILHNLAFFSYINWITFALHLWLHPGWLVEGETASSFQYPQACRVYLGFHLLHWPGFATSLVAHWPWSALQTAWQRGKPAGCTEDQSLDLCSNLRNRYTCPSHRKLRCTELERFSK